MDLLETWKKLESETLSQPVAVPIRFEEASKHPLQKLARVYRMNAGFIVFFLICFGVLFFLFKEPLVKGSLLLLTLFYFLGLIANRITVKKLGLNEPLDKSVKSALEHTYNSVSRNIRFQELFSLLFYPVAGAAGFFMGIAVMSDNLNSLIKETYIIVTLIAVLIIMIPLCYLLAKRLHRIAYGKSLQELKHLIAELEKPE